MVVTRKKHMLAAVEECSFGMHTDDYIGCAVASAGSVSKDINGQDDQTVGCAIACAARADISSNSNSEDISDEDDDSSFCGNMLPRWTEIYWGGKVFSIGRQCYRKKRIIHQPFQKHPVFYFAFLIS